MTMNSIRIAIAAIALSTSSLAFASDANATQMFGRDTVMRSTPAVSGHVGAQDVSAVAGRQGGLSQDAKLDAYGKARTTANLVERDGRA